jgi:transcriptional regulator with XRE-family HTH domain
MTRRVTAREVFARSLRDVRKRRGITQEELCSRMSAIGEPLTKSSLSEIESGKRGVNLDRAMAFAYALDTPLPRMIRPEAGELMEVEPGVAVDADWLSENAVARQAIDDLFAFARARRRANLEGEPLNAKRAEDQILAALDLLLDRVRPAEA